MNSVKQSIVNFIKDEEGLTTVEYAIGGALVAAAVVGAFTLLGTNITARINAIAGVIGV